MKSRSADQAALPEPGRGSGTEQARRALHLRALFEASRELSGIIQPRRILDTFLLLAMGPLGLCRGMAVVKDTRNDETLAVQRGFSEAEARRIRDSFPAAFSPFINPDEPASEASMPTALWISSLEDGAAAFAQGTDLALFWSQDSRYLGMILLGAKLDGRPVDADDADVLLNLTNVLVSALRHALACSSISQLNSDLNRRNAELARALERAQAIQTGLDRQVFHLKSMNDLADELSSLSDPASVSGAFLLHAQGTFSAVHGLLVLVDRAEKKASFVLRGTADGLELDFEKADRLLYACFEAAEVRRIEPMVVSRVHDPEAVLGKFGLPAGLGTAVFFVVEPTLLGLVALGAKIDGAALDREEADLLGAQTASFMAFFKNARSMARIERLNRELEASNADLRRTIGELREARTAIAVLERAGERIRNMLAREGERVNRAAPMDFAFILALALLLGALFNFVSPTGIPLLPETWNRPDPPMVDVREAKRLVDAGAVMVDARLPEYHRQKRIVGSVNVPPGLFDMAYMMRFPAEPLDRTIIVYGRDVSRSRDKLVAWRFSVRDHSDVRVLDGGIEEWRAAGFQVEP